MISKDNLDNIHSLNYPIRAFRWLHNQTFDVAFYKKLIRPKVPKKYGMGGGGKFIVATAPRIQNVS